MRDLQERVQHHTSVRANTGATGAIASCECGWRDVASKSEFVSSGDILAITKAFRAMLKSAEKHWHGVAA